jgi:hypothetical protein
METSERWSINNDDCEIKMWTENGTGRFYEIRINGILITGHEQWPRRGTKPATRQELIEEKMAYLVERMRRQEELRLGRVIRKEDIKVKVK